MLKKTMCLKVSIENAQEAKNIVKSKNVLDFDFSPEKIEDHFYIPIKKKFNTENIDIKVEFVSKELKSNKKENYKSKIEDLIGEKDFKSAYDVVGDIAIIESDEKFLGKEKEIANIIMNSQKNIKSVFIKDGAHEGELRIQKLKYLAGINDTVTIHKENGIRLKLDISKVYFSVRSATERLRVSNLVKKEENVLVMFSGCGPFVCVIGKLSKPQSIVGIEKNKDGNKYAQESIKLNKLSNAVNLEGDVRKIIPKLNKKFDRIVMPLPKQADVFLETALLAAKDKATLHIYQFLKDEEHKDTELRLKKEFKKLGWNSSSYKFVKCGQQSPYTFRVCIDVEVRKA